MGLLRIKRNLEKQDYRKLLQLFSCFPTTILKFLGIVVSTYNYRFNGKKVAAGYRGRGAVVPGSVGDTACRGLGKIRCAGVCAKHGVRNK